MKHKISFKQRVKSFFKKNSYALVVAGSALVLAIALAITAFVGSDISRKEQLNQNANQESLNESQNGIPMEDDAQASSTAPVIFTYPVKNYTLGNTFTDTALVYNATLKEYTTHLGVDFIVSNGEEVMASYDGVVETVDYDSLKGTSIVIDHGDGLKTTYESLASEVSVEVGQQVSGGQVIGKASNSAGNEKNLGAHVHFGAILNGQEVNPMTYLGEK